MTEFILAAFTQYHENYGDADQPRWKPKGGWVYCLATLSVSEAADLAQRGRLADLVRDRAAKRGIEYRNPASEEYIIDWSLMTEAEYRDARGDWR